VSCASLHIDVSAKNWVKLSGWDVVAKFRQNLSDLACESEAYRQLETVQKGITHQLPTFQNVVMYKVQCSLYIIN
jgi:hypothetical protein